MSVQTKTITMKMEAAPSSESFEIAYFPYLVTSQQTNIWATPVAKA
jgi:hypothetical protein